MALRSASLSRIAWLYMFPLLGSFDPHVDHLCDSAAGGAGISFWPRFSAYQVLGQPIIVGTEFHGMPCQSPGSVSMSACDISLIYSVSAADLSVE